MNLQFELYFAQNEHWPQTGHHILAQYDDETIIVYQAYKPSIGHFAVAHGYFGGDFKFERMSWIKPNFLWMMYRCGWGTKPDQEVVLAIYLKRSAFDDILAQAVHSTFIPEIYESEAAWKKALAKSDVRLQWDPDHHPNGAKLERRAIQLGLRGQTLKAFALEWIVKIEDISEFVREQHQPVQAKAYDQLLTPQERVYPVRDENTARKIGM
jgi:hypothetical protein